MLNADFKERLASVLAYASKDCDAAVIAIEERFSTVRSLLTASLDELSEIPGLGEQGAFLLRLSFELGARRVIDRFKFGKSHTEEEIIEYFKARFLCKTNETVYCMFLDERERAISCDFITEGTVSASDPLPRRMLEIAIKRRAKYVIVAHNHPGGISKSSPSDIRVTADIANLLLSSGKMLLCHYVIAGNEHEKIVVDKD